MNEEEKPVSSPHRTHLSRGETIPKPRPSSFVEWPPGRPPGGPLPPKQEQQKPPTAES